MVVELKDNPKYDNKNLVTKEMAPFEYVIISKPEYAEPLRGEGTYGPWFLYNVRVHEINTFDPNTGNPLKTNPEEDAAYFAKGKALQEKFAEVPINTKVKIYMQETKNGRKAYTYELVDAVQSDTTTQNPQPDASVDDKIKALKDNGVDKESIKKTVSLDHDVTEDFVGLRYDAL